jgi:hypothetical protein
MKNDDDMKISKQENIIFELNDDAVFETALATMQHSMFAQ